MFIETNYQAILAEIARTPLEKANLQLGVKVVDITTCSREEETDMVVVRTEKGEKLLFNEVVMTTPLGWLKRNKHVFKPLLPPRMLAGIDAISIGHLEKVSL